MPVPDDYWGMSGYSPVSRSVDNRPLVVATPAARTTTVLRPHAAAAPVHPRQNAAGLLVNLVDRIGTRLEGALGEEAAQEWVGRMEDQFLNGSSLIHLLEQPRSDGEAICWEYVRTHVQRMDTLTASNMDRVVSSNTFDLNSRRLRCFV
jgi:hypothetical protein